jgi:hypothetical protein
VLAFEDHRTCHPPSIAEALTVLDREESKDYYSSCSEEYKEGGGMRRLLERTFAVETTAERASVSQAGHSGGHSTRRYSALLERTGWTTYLP